MNEWQLWAMDIRKMPFRRIRRLEPRRKGFFGPTNGRFWRCQTFLLATLNGRFVLMSRLLAVPSPGQTYDQFRRPGQA